MTVEHLTRSHLQRSIVACLNYILDLQSADGSWTDWALPPGSSNTWTTGYVGYMLGGLPPNLRLRVANSRRASSQRLLQQQCEGGGWAYNEAVESDADSTAFAVLCMACDNFRVPEVAYNRLRAFQRPDGGFATYLLRENRNSWTVSHPDVTPIALLALMTKYGPNVPFVESGIRYVKREATRAGVWHSFWWESCLYGTQATLSLLSAAQVDFNVAITRASLRRIKPGNAFETALLASSMLFVDDVAPALKFIDRLLSEQQRNGSWKSEAIMRITNQDCFKPWACKRAGPLFADSNRLFTSATVLAALCRAYANVY